jgi:hypothetical protein
MHCTAGCPRPTEPGRGRSECATERLDGQTIFTLRMRLGVPAANSAAPLDAPVSGAPALPVLGVQAAPPGLGTQGGRGPRLARKQRRVPARIVENDAHHVKSRKPMGRLRRCYEMAIPQPSFVAFAFLVGVAAGAILMSMLAVVRYERDRAVKAFEPGIATKPCLRPARRSRRIARRRSFPLGWSTWSSQGNAPVRRCGWPVARSAKP